MKNNFYKLFLLIPIVFFCFVLFFMTMYVKNRLGLVNPGDHFTDLNGVSTSELHNTNNNLNIIVVTMKNIGMKSSDELIFRLIYNNEVLREIEFNAMNTGDPADVRLQFDPISGSSDSTYRLEILRKNLDKEHLQIFVNNNQDFAFRSYYRSDINLSSFLVELKYFSLKIFQDKIFFIFWLTTLSFVSYLIIKSNNVNQE